MSSAENRLPSANLPRRLAAMLYDAMLLFGVLFTATIPTLFFDGAPQQSVSNEQVVHELPTISVGWPFQLYLLVISIGFFCLFWRKNGQTLGMQAWRIKLEDCAGNRITYLQCMKRLLGAAVSLSCLGAGYWWVWLDKNHMSWHDRWSQTRVVQLPKKNDTEPGKVT